VVLNYAYDAAGQRIDMVLNGVLETHHDFDAANQVLGQVYDVAGNVISDTACLAVYTMPWHNANATAMNDRSYVYLCVRACVGRSGCVGTVPGYVGLWRRHWTNRANRANPGPLVWAASVRTPVPAPIAARFYDPILRRGRDDRARNRARGWPRQARIRWWRRNRCPIGPLGPIIPA
jgi:hypothetical protein